MVFLYSSCVACAPDATKILETRDYQATFECDDGQRMHVQFTPYNAVLEFRSVSVAMTQQPAADGYRYSGQGQSLRVYRNEAAWTDDKRVIRRCREVVAAKPTAPIGNH